TGLLSDIADALQYAASLEVLYQGNTPFFTQVTDEVTGERTTVLNRVLRRVGRRARVESGNIVAQMVPSDGPLRDLALETVRQWIAEHATDAYRDGDRLRLQTTDALKEAYEQIDNWAHPAEVLVDRFKRYEDPEVQRQIVGLLRGWGDVSNTVAWARDEILRALSPTTPRAPGPAGERSDLPDLTLDQWETLARAVIAFQMHTSYGIATSSEVQISEFPSLKNEEALEGQLPFWDPSGVSLVLDILVRGVMSNPSAQPSPLLAAQLDLQRELAPQLPTVPEEAAEAAFYKMVAPLRVDSDRGTRSGRVGKWHALVPSLMHSAVGAVMSSAAS